MNEMARIKIGSWIADPTLNLLERGAKSIKIEPRAMEVLMFLARHHAAVVSVDELIASVWKGVVVGDGSVYLAIRQLRQALEDPAEDTRYIETIPKRGYRLTVPVDLEPMPVQGAPEAPIRSRFGRPFRRWWLAVAVVCTVILAVLAITLREGARPVPANSVAVLPFDNLSADPEQGYFSDGITVEILNTLSRVGDLRVTGRASSFHFKGRNVDLRTIGEALGVEHVLEGSVRKVGDQVRITAQLNNARTGQQLWSETYERRFDDIFQVQDEIAKSVADALQVKLGVGDVGRMPGMTRDVAAYDEYLRGMALNLEWRPESFPLAILHLQRAVAIDPSFSLAWAGLNTVYTNGAIVVPNRAEEWRQKGSEALDRARALTPDAPHVLLEIGIGETRRGNWLEAAAVYERLLASYEQHGMVNQAWGPRGVFLLGVGRVREAIPALERARAQEPLAPAFASFLSQANLADGNFSGALAEVERGLELDGLETILHQRGLVIALNQHDRAEIDKRLDAMPDDDPAVRLYRRLAQVRDAPADAAIEIRRLAPGADRPEKALLAQWAAYYDEPQLALELLAEVAPHLSPLNALWQPLMRDVRKLPAFKDLVRNIGLVDYWRAYGWSDFCHPVSAEDFVCE